MRDKAIGEIAGRPVSITTRSGIRIHGIQTGVLAIKQAHAHLRRPAALRLLSIVLDTTWTPLLPLLTWVIEHPEGLFVIDTGERAAASDIDKYMAGDPANRWFFKRNLPLFVTAAEELPSQLRGLGLAPEAVQTVVLTHLHGDHTGGLASFRRLSSLWRAPSTKATCARRWGPCVASGQVPGHRAWWSTRAQHSTLSRQRCR
jgi:glyoxylase-like metal-dependent hydrolase (beta-lactamase superfamily II)